MSMEPGDRPQVRRLSILPSRAMFDKRMTPMSLLVLGMLCTYADREGWCFPSQSTLSKLLGISRRTVNRHVGNLTKWGYLTSEQRTRENGSLTSNLYRVMYDVEIPEEYEVQVEEQEIEEQGSEEGVGMAEVFGDSPILEEASKVLEDKSPAKAKPKPKQEAVFGPWQVGKALAGVCRMDFDINKGQMLSEGKRISGIKGFSIERLGRLYGKPDGLWYKYDWRGKKGQAPTPLQIRQSWTALMEKLEEGGEQIGGEEGWLYA